MDSKSKRLSKDVDDDKEDKGTKVKFSLNVTNFLPLDPTLDINLLQENPDEKNLIAEDSENIAAETLLMTYDQKHQQLEGEHEKAIQEKAGKVLQLLQSVPGDDFFETHNQFDSEMQRKFQNASLLLIQNKPAEWEEEQDPTDEYLDNKETERLDRLKNSRGPVLKWTFFIIFHLTVTINFLLAWFDSFKLIMEDAKLQALLLKGEFNCLEIYPTADWFHHSVNIFHALMSACVLFAENRGNSMLCISSIFSQGIHGFYKAFHVFMQLRYDEGSYAQRKIIFLMCALVSDIAAIVVIIHRFYDLTDRVRVRASNYASVYDGISMNDEIIYQNQSSFLQRKSILREAIATQVYTVIKKIGNYKSKGLEADHVELFRNLHAARNALTDVDNVVNRHLLRELRKATANRLKEYDANPNIRASTAGLAGPISKSKLFLVDFGER